ncbi:hypothetical protein Sipo8835_27840 [Streptomyces ipomoeae]|jgi:hypothetical protein|uniref:Uncharacterized protein n=2 Tax=Streptomyces ipomoeae TaxID=103232 RepID=L1L7D5_9ACTN|nr:hypothetical protein [Streptomyces ipomoeae]EKX68615.1 hypothetical protein STRIP9103_02664 [Streptomyces ipomoeae 91-03]MDX2697287.1 hypothetical protein [Streptomyces ipomoeae]MDX2824775.1 hypothetical protein [Streptomyces ipomoeae]MDX2841834.1 hypothetical protein [Streptomyces ipomoeae]MDX2875253.1 hypothetical protein [Streptomyces ipomoeae]
MARILTIGSRATRVAAVCAIAASVALTQAGSANAAAKNRLPNGSKLKAGQCISEGPASRKASFCVGKYYDLTMHYKKKSCTVYKAKGHIKGPSSYVQVAKNGDVRFYQYSGGRVLWRSKTTQFKGAALVVGSSRPGNQAVLGVDTGKAFFIIKKCPFNG